MDITFFQTFPYFNDFSDSHRLQRLSDYSSEVLNKGYTKVYRNMFRVIPYVALGLIFFTVLMQKVEKQRKVLSALQWLSVKHAL